MSVGIYIFSKLLYKHEAYTRYPDGIKQPDDYTLEFGIVNLSVEISNKMEKIISMISDIIQTHLN
jgi:hypothetical protein